MTTTTGTGEGIRTTLTATSACCCGGLSINLNSRAGFVDQEGMRYAPMKKQRTHETDVMFRHA